MSLRPVVLPEIGLAISGMLAEILGVRAGDFVEVDLLEGSAADRVRANSSSGRGLFRHPGHDGWRSIGAADAGTATVKA